MIKLIAFDWNGTLLEDVKIARRASELSLQDLGIQRNISMREFQATFTIPISTYWANLGLDPAYFKKYSDKIDRAYINRSEPQEQKCRTRTGARDVLRWLEKNTITSVIYSNHIIPLIEKALLRFKLRGLVDDILARPFHNGSQHKKRSKDQLLLAYVRSKRLKPEEVLTIGDTEEEIEIGKKFGYATVGLTGGWNSAARLKKHSPDFIIHSLKELIPIIKKLNSKH